MDNPKEKNNQSLKEQAINKKGTQADGVEVDPQTQKKNEVHQPRDTA
ncbi:hypothetical protein [Portibacter marinus]|nr:hypothetical protein [Portibacter marinus]